MRLLIPCLLLSAASLLPAAEPSTAPMLRIEAGMHTTTIWRKSSDAAGKIALSVSDDKTARLWDLSTGRLLRVLRPPIEPTDEGKLNGAALSPDGTLAAIAGYTGWDWESKTCVYLFNTSTGRMVRRLDGLPFGILDMALSPSGRRLAIAFGGEYGVTVWDLGTGQELGKDPDYAGRSNGLDWYGETRLASSCYDGRVRLHEVSDSGLRLLASATTQAGKNPYAVAFSPDGSRLAVGFSDARAVEVRDARDLKMAFAPDVTDVTIGNLINVAWSTDGQTLAAGGMWQDQNANFPLRLWSQGGRGAYRDVPLTQSTVMDLRTLPGGGFLFSSGAPAWGVVRSSSPGARLQPQVFGLSPVADFRAMGPGFRLSADGSEVAFAYQLFGKEPASFSLVDRSLVAGSAASQVGGRPPVTNTLPITDWADQESPKLGDQPLPLDKYETSRSLAIAQDASFFALGTEWWLRCFSKDGKELWKSPAPGIVWGVNLTADGKMVVAAYADGTIRWHRADTGRELLAFFSHADRKRWVLWSPEGYYDCSADGESLIGWHVNRGKEAAADFFPAAKFRDQFYRPDVIQQIFVHRDVTLALSTANTEAGRKSTKAVRIEDVIARMQPPVVELLVGGAGATVEAVGGRVTLRYRVRQGGSSLTRMKLLVDGRPLDAAIPLPANDAAEGTFSVAVPAQECVLVLLAENSTAVSEPATLRVTPGRQTPGSGGVKTTGLKPKLYLLAAGISDYARNDRLADLNYAAKDAADFAAAFQLQKGALYEDVEVKVLTNEKATAGDVLDGLEWVKKQTTSKDIAVVFLSGHGENDENLRYYFCPHDYDHNKRLRTGISIEDIRETLASIPGKVLFFIDSCHAGNALGKLFSKGSGSQVDITRLVNDLSSTENGAIVFASSTGRQLSVESEEWKNGAFTKAIVEGLKGRADLLNNGKITVSGLETWIAERVKELSEGTQTPTVAKPQTVPDFPIGLSR